jgi:hypothetical protein
MMGNRPFRRRSITRLEDQAPRDQSAATIEKHISFAFVRERLKASYRTPAVLPLIPSLLRILLIGYCMASPASGSW